MDGGQVIHLLILLLLLLLCSIVPLKVSKRTTKQVLKVGYFRIYIGF